MPASDAIPGCVAALIIADAAASSFVPECESARYPSGVIGFADAVFPKLYMTVLTEWSRNSAATFDATTCRCRSVIDPEWSMVTVISVGMCWTIVPTVTQSRPATDTTKVPVWPLHVDLKSTVHNAGLCTCAKDAGVSDSGRLYAYMFFAWGSLCVNTDKGNRHCILFFLLYM